MAENRKFAILDANIGSEEIISDYEVSNRQQNSVNDTVEDIDVTYVSADDEVPETAEEVVVDGEYVEVVEDEPPHSGATFNSMGCVNFVVEPQEDYITPETERVHCSDELDRRNLPRYPVAIATLPFLPKKIPNLKAEWTINKRKKFLAYRIIGSLSRENRSDFIELMGLLGSSALLSQIRHPVNRNTSLDHGMSISGSVIDRYSGIPLKHYDCDTTDDDEFEESINRDMAQLPINNYIETSPGKRKKVEEEPNMRFCPSCRLVLKRGIFYHHGRLIRKYGRCDVFTPKRFPCGEVGCPERLATVEKLCEHMFQVHNAPTQVQTKIFDSEAKFHEFLNVLESSGNYRMSRGSKELRRGVIHYYRCNRVFSMPKSKTGDDHVNKKPCYAGDPFMTTSGKLCIRTEEACTAFYTKCYLSDGRILVRYCSHHLHREDRIRFPLAVRSRIYEMATKKLPVEVIIMVLRKERHLFSVPGTALEQRILSITPQEVQSILSCMKRSLEKAAAEPATRKPNSREEREIEETLQEENRELLEDCQKYNEEKECAKIDTEEHNQGDLTELELATLEEYEQNHGIVLDEFQSICRKEHKKRLLRERVRDTVYTLGRMIRNFRFVSLSNDVLSRSLKTLEEILGLWSEDKQQGEGLVCVEGCDENTTSEAVVDKLDVENVVKDEQRDKNESLAISDPILCSNNEEQLMKQETFSEDTSKFNSSKPLVTRSGRVVKRKYLEDI